ncbi:hypothetical protein EDB85DRAFT_2219148 [Lactarius pseudohatsudake]|nr:hypothetical protein EDB85DRAFT_2253338 [Lactarius pseudohatsudake]KAH9013483.1 hypothetical protein EDB85DRAFT_2219148 [Lactarius pseudohatsudake]
MASASASTSSLLSPAWGTPCVVSSSARPKALNDAGAGVKAYEIGKVILVGDGTYATGRRDGQTHFHNVTDILLFGVTPTLGVETLSSITTELIPRNATTPTKNLLLDRIANVVAKDKATNKDQSMTRIKHAAISSRSRSRSSGFVLTPRKDKVTRHLTDPREVVAKGQAGDGAVTADANREKTNDTRL